MVIRNKRGDDIMRVVSFVFDIILEIIEKTLDNIMKIFNIFAALFSGEREEARNLTFTYFADIFNDMLTFFNNIMQLILDRIAELPGLV